MFILSNTRKFQSQQDYYGLEIVNENRIFTGIIFINKLFIMFNNG